MINEDQNKDSKKKLPSVSPDGKAKKTEAQDKNTDVVPSTPARSSKPKETEKLTLPVVPIREGVLFPSTESVLTFGRVISVEAIHEAKRSQSMVVLLSQRK